MLLCPWNLPGANTGCHFPTPGDLPDPEIKPVSPKSPALQSDSLPPSHPTPTSLLSKTTTCLESALKMLVKLSRQQYLRITENDKSFNNLHGIIF